MAPLSIIGALSALPLALAHMQMSDPSPINDPHQSPLRPGETLDYNYLNPLNADGSNFACKGYHLNTPLNTVATFEAGSKQTLRLRGSATHSGGSCQISLSCDRGSKFHVMKSIMGGCPLSDSYDFRVPSDIPAAKKCLLAWTWFNRIGNREMYMNCAVVDITNKNKDKRDTQVSAARALARYPEMFVANLANINDCKVQETTDVIFDTPGREVVFGNGDNASMKPSFAKGQCTGKPSKYAGSKAPPPNNSGGGGGGGGGGGDNGQWTPPKQSTSSSNGCTAAMRSSGRWYPVCFGGNSRTVQQPAQQQEQEQTQKPKQDEPKLSTQESNQEKPDLKVQEELDAYLSKLYSSRHARRNTTPAADYSEKHEQKTEHPAQPHEHVHTKHCKDKNPEHPSGSHYHNKDLDSYPGHGTDYSNKNVYHTQDSQQHEDSDSAYKRVSRQERWTAYNKRQEVARITPIKYYRGDESAYSQPQASDSYYTQKQASTDASTQSSTDTSTQSSTDASTKAPAQKSYWDMTEQEKFEAFLRRMVELSTNMASLVKYASFSSLTPSTSYYPPSSAYGRNEVPDAQDAAAVRRHARRGLPSPAQVYTGPAVGTISASGEATDAEDGFKAWFPDLVQGLMTKRQLVDPVTSEASAESGNSVSLFDALLAGFWKVFGDPFNLYGDDTDSPVADASGVPLVLGEPDIYSNQPDFPDFEIPDLHHFHPPPWIYHDPNPPQLLPGYVLGPDGPMWVGEGPDPLADDFSESEPIVIITIDPVDPNLDFFPGEDVPALSCTEPIPQIGFNSCLGGCNHTAEEIAAHETYLQDFAAEQAAYEECLLNQALDVILPPAGIFSTFDEDGDEDDVKTEAEDASGRRPRPGMSHPLIPYPLPENFTGPYPSNSSSTASPAPASVPYANATTPAGNETALVELQPYQNKTLGELVNDILNDPDVLGPVPADNPADDTNALQEAVDQAENGITVPLNSEPVSIDPNALESVADALPWFMGPGPVVVDSSADVDALDDTNALQEAVDQAESGITAPLSSAPVSIDPNALESIADALPWFMGPGPVVVDPPTDTPAQ